MRVRVRKTQPEVHDCSPQPVTLMHLRFASFAVIAL
jgi:hypothetical protein